MRWTLTPDGSWALHAGGKLVACICKRVAYSTGVYRIATTWYVVSRWNGSLWQAVAKARSLRTAKKLAES